MFSKLFWKIKKGFTLYELTVVVGIVSVLSGLVYVTVQPAELLARSRDSQRISDINQISALIAQKRTQQVRVRSLGATSTFYISLPSTNSDCSDLLSLLPTIPAGMAYHCVPQNQLRNVDGTGWIPIDFTADKISSLPIDSVNTAASGLYYIYANTGSSYELSTSLESNQLKDLNGGKDGGQNPNAYEAGSSLAAIPNVTSIGGTLPIVCSSGATRTMYNVSSVSCGTACASETQTCNSTGTAWSGTYASGSCTASTRTAYQALTSACGTYGSNNENQTCQTNGTWSGTYTLTSAPSATTQTRFGALTSACGTYGTTSETQTCQSSGSFSGTLTLTSPPSATTQTRYAALTSACGTYGSDSQTQTCLSSGSFSGTYTLASAPSVTTQIRYAAATSACGTYGSNSQTQSCQSNGAWSPNTYTLTSPPSASTRTMYSSASVACGNSCASQTQTCQSSGSWSGTYAYGSCTVDSCDPCLGVTCDPYCGGTSNTTYYYNGSCSAGSCSYSSSITAGTCGATCTPGTTRTRYASLSVACGTASGSETQTCNSTGTGWSGSYTLTSPPAASTRTMYAAATSACGTYGSNSETQTCQTNGAWTGSYTLSSAPSATTRTMYAAATSACGTYGSNSETQTCQSSGSFSGTYTLTSPPSAATRTMYSTSAPACGTTCASVSQTQTCQSSGAWSPNTYTYASCTYTSQEWLYYDDDGDGYGAGPANLRCYDGNYWVRNNTDCYDNYTIPGSELVHPGAGYQTYSGPNGWDWDCDGQIQKSLSYTTNSIASEYPLYFSSTGNPNGNCNGSAGGCIQGGSINLADVACGQPVAECRSFNMGYTMYSTNNAGYCSNIVSPYFIGFSGTQNCK